VLDLTAPSSCPAAPAQALEAVRLEGPILGDRDSQGISARDRPDHAGLPDLKGASRVVISPIGTHRTRPGSSCSSGQARGVVVRILGIAVPSRPRARGRVARERCPAQRDASCAPSGGRCATTRSCSSPRHSSCFTLIRSRAPKRFSGEISSPARGSRPRAVQSDQPPRRTSAAPAPSGRAPTHSRNQAARPRPRGSVDHRIAASSSHPHGADRAGIDETSSLDRPRVGSKQGP
jgi:hypothetical protein